MTAALFESVRDYIARSLGPVARFAHESAAELRAKLLGIAAEVDGIANRLRETEMLAAELRGRLDEIRSAVPKHADIAADVLARIPPAPPPVDASALAEAVAKMVPLPKNGRDADEASIVKSVIAQLPEVKPGRDGVDAPPLAEIVAAVLAAMPADDAVVLTAEVGEIDHSAAIRAAVEALPKAKDGRDGPSLEEVVSEVLRIMPKPQDGQPGRDQFDLHVIESVEPEKAYPRGTVARHAGGLIRAFRATETMSSDIERSGWHVAMNGLASFAIEQTGERTFVARATMTSGKVEELAWRMDSILYRGVYREDRDYEKGDTVTFGGAMWVATIDKPSKPRESESGWQLSVKPGRDGRDRTST